MYFRPGQTDITEQQAYIYASVIVLCIFIPALCFHPFVLYIQQVGMRIRLGCCDMLYQKALRITKSMAVDGFEGQVINLMSVDVAKFDQGVTYVHDLWKGPLELFILGYFIYRELNVCGLVGIGFMLLFIPLQGRENNPISTPINYSYPPIYPQAGSDERRPTIECRRPSEPTNGSVS